MPAKLPFLIVLLLVTVAARSQKKANDERFYFWTSDWRTTNKVDSAAYLSTMTRVGDTCWQMDTWRFAGPMFASEQYRDEQAQTLHGTQFYYHSSGYIDSTGEVRGGLPDGEWNYANDSGRIIMKKHFDRGRLINTEPAEPSDSISTKLKEGETESTFPGGLSAWRKYLLKKMEYPERALKLAMKGEVQVQFIVIEDGAIEQPRICKSVEYSLDLLALSIIRSSPRWNPAYKDGQKVRSYKKQPLVYRF